MSDQDEVSAALPAYDIGEELGRGAWGVVFAGVHRQLGRDVAVKQLPRNFGADAEVRARFLAEARLLASLDHPHVVRVLDFVEHDGLCLIVMERMTGGTLWTRHRAQRLTPQAACAVIVATSAGLHHAHGKGVLHRDVKPENLMFTGDGVPKVADFGIAKVVGGSQTMATRAGYVMGTPSYLAPEQARGGELSPATDVYATGTVLYELLAGALPYPEATDPVIAIYQHVHEDHRPLLDAAPHLPHQLATLTERALAREPDDRYPTAAAFGAAVDDTATAIWGPAWAADTGITLRGIDALMSRRAPATAMTPLPESVPVVSVAKAEVDSPPTARRRPSRRVAVIGALVLALVVAGLAWSALKDPGVSTGPAHVVSPEDIAVDSEGNIYLLEDVRNRVIRMRPGGKPEVFAGTGISGVSGDGGDARDAQLDAVSSLAIDGDDNLYIASYSQDSPIRMVTPDHTITAVPGSNPDRGWGVSGLAVDEDGVLYITSETARQIFRLEEGKLEVIAGSGASGSSGDGGPAVDAQFVKPTGIAVDFAGDVYIADGELHRVRRFTPGGSIEAFAGTGNDASDGDGGEATKANLSYPYGVAVDDEDNVYIGDVGGERVRRVDDEGIITTVAGVGEEGFSGDDGPARRARLNTPARLAVDEDGNVYIGDVDNNRVRKVSVDNSNIMTVA